MGFRAIIKGRVCYDLGLKLRLWSEFLNGLKVNANKPEDVICAREGKVEAHLIKRKIG